MKRVHIRQWMVILLSGFLQQPVSGMMNPFGIAYFGAAYMWPEHRSLLPVISLIGMAAGIPQNMLLKYLGILTVSYTHLQAVMNNAGGVYNHQMFFRLLHPPVNENPMEPYLTEAFGSYEDVYKRQVLYPV